VVVVMRAPERRNGISDNVASVHRLALLPAGSKWQHGRQGTGGEPEFRQVVPEWS